MGDAESNSNQVETEFMYDLTIFLMCFCVGIVQFDIFFSEKK